MTLPAPLGLSPELRIVLSHVLGEDELQRAESHGVGVDALLDRAALKLFDEHKDAHSFPSTLIRKARQERSVIPLPRASGALPARRIPTKG